MLICDTYTLVLFPHLVLSPPSSLERCLPSGSFRSEANAILQPHVAAAAITGSHWLRVLFEECVPFLFSLFSHELKALPCRLLVNIDEQ